MTFPDKLYQIQYSCKNKLEGPCKLVGICAMTIKLCMVHNIKFPLDVVNAMMYDLKPDALEERQPCKRGGCLSQMKLT